MRPLLLLLSILLIPLSLLSFLTAGTVSIQKDISCHLLWYKGKKIKPNILLTDNGDTVRFNPGNATVSVTGKSRQLDKMMLELNKTPQRMEEMLKKLAVNVPKAALRSYGFQIRTSFRQIHRNYNKTLSNTLTLPDTKIPGIRTNGGKGATWSAGENETEIAFHNAVLSLEEYAEQHKNDPFSSLPVPPQYDYSYCGECDTEIQQQYQEEVDQFIGAISSEEKVLLDKAIGISRKAYSLLPERANTHIQKRVSHLIGQAMQRMLRKVNFLVLEYIDNAAYCEAVANLALRVDRQMQLLGLAPDPNISSAFERSCTTLTGMIDRAIDENDYSVARNINLLLSTVRKYQLLGLEMPGNVFEKAFAFNKDETYKMR